MQTMAALATANCVCPDLGRSDFEAIAAILQSEARIKLTDGKMTLVHARLSRRLRERGLASFHDYVALIRSDLDERERMVTALTTNHTHFFREPHHFDHLRSDLMPLLRQKAAKSPVRMWSAGCSSGEEVYTMAMCLLGTDRSQGSWLRSADLRLLATDISPPVVEATRRALYPAAATEAVPAAYRQLWMRESQGGLLMAEEARALVTARTLNLFGAWPMQRRFDAIFCRNVMIYFDDAAKAELEARLVDQLLPGGVLYIGHSERLLGSAKNGMTSCGQTIYRKAGELV